MYIRHVLTKYNKDVATDTEKQIIISWVYVHIQRKTITRWLVAGQKPKQKKTKSVYAVRLYSFYSVVRNGFQRHSRGQFFYTIRASTQ